MKPLLLPIALLLAALSAATFARAKNPIVTHIFTADPAARAFGNRVYLYTTHDLPKATYWDTVDWELLSTDDMVHWKDHGAIFRVKDFAWATRWAWAPDCISANGKYYLFLPVDRTKIGVAVADAPTGPFHDAIGGPLLDNAKQPDAGPEPIDPALFTNDDGRTYLYFGCRYPKVVRLDRSLTKFDGPIQSLKIVDAKGEAVPLAAPGQDPVLPEGYGEAPYLFKRGGKYYFIYSNGWAAQSTQVYAMGDSPTGPFTYAGEVMAHVPCVTHHGSVVEFHGKWYIFYHTSEISNGNTFQRGVCVDELTFAPDGKINRVTATADGPAAVVVQP